MKIDISVETPISKSPRVRQLEALFDCPVEDKARLSWQGEIPIEGEPWSIGLIVGPSGSGKSTILNSAFGRPVEFGWSAGAVVDDFSKSLSMEKISHVCRSVGFNTIPAWMRPYAVLSNGEKFRVEMARRLLETEGTITVDEFTSVVDRQVAQVGAFAVAKYVRKNKMRLVAASCHYDIIEWLQPDWVLEAATMQYTRRLLQRSRPEIEVTVSRVPYSSWRLFAPFHYLSADLNKAAQCFGLFVGDRIAGFTGVLHMPHARSKNLKRFTRIVTLPDWQGLGLGPVLKEKVASAYTALGFRIRSYPAHPQWVRTLANDPKWLLVQKPGVFNSARSASSSISDSWRQGSRSCSVFEYIGPAMDRSQAKALIAP